MPAAYQNLYLEQGTTFNTTITLDDVYGNIYNLHSYSANSMMRRSYTTANATAIFTCSINANNGTITISLDAPTTANIPGGRYVYDTKIIDASNNVTRILEGIVDVSPSASH